MATAKERQKVISRVMDYETEDGFPMGKIIGGLLGVIVVFFGISILFGSWYTVDQGERGVLLRNGKLVGVAEPGLGFKMPLIDSKIPVSIQTHKVTLDKMASYSRDQQTAEIRLSVNYRVPADQVADVYAAYGGLQGLEDRIIMPRIYEEAKNVFGQFNAITAVQERARLNVEMRAAIANSVKGPVIIEGVQIENIDFSKEYEKSIEKRMMAEVEVQQLRQNAEREKVQAQITVTKATAEADAVRARAIAEADAIKLRGTAEATAIQARGDALAKNPNLVGLVQAERWNGTLPTTMVPGSAVPMLNLLK